MIRIQLLVALALVLACDDSGTEPIDLGPVFDVAALDGAADGAADLGSDGPTPDGAVDAAVLDSAADVAVDVAIDAAPDVVVDGALDAAPDAELDAEPDAELDAEPDAELDAESDAELDAAPDAELDAAPDAELDAAPDAELDAAADAEPDAEPDAELDAEPDAEPDAFCEPIAEPTPSPEPTWAGSPGCLPDRFFVHAAPGARGFVDEFSVDLVDALSLTANRDAATLFGRQADVTVVVDEVVDSRAYQVAFFDGATRLAVVGEQLCTAVTLLRTAAGSAAGEGVTVRVGRECTVNAMGYEAEAGLADLSWSLDRILADPALVAQALLPDLPPPDINLQSVDFVLIDSGLDPDVATVLNADILDIADADLDPSEILHAHGSAMALLARRVSPNIHVRSIRILGDDGIGTVADLARALDLVANERLCSGGQQVLAPHCDGTPVDVGDQVCCKAGGSPNWREVDQCQPRDRQMPELCEAVCCVDRGVLTADGACGGPIGPANHPACSVCCEGDEHNDRSWVVNLSLGAPPELLRPRGLTGADACVTWEDPVDSAVTTTLRRLADLDARGRSVSVFAAAGNRGTRTTWLDNYAQHFQVGAHFPVPGVPAARPDSCDGAWPLPSAPYWFFPGNLGRWPHCNPGVATPTRLLQGVGAHDVNDLPTVQSIAGGRAALVAPGQLVYVPNPGGIAATPSAIECAPAVCDGVTPCAAGEACDEGQCVRTLTLPMNVTGTSAATALTAALAAHSQAVAQVTGDALDARAIRRALYFSAPQIIEPAPALSAFENAPVRRPNRCALTHLLTDGSPECQAARACVIESAPDANAADDLTPDCTAASEACTVLAACDTGTLGHIQWSGGYTPSQECADTARCASPWAPASDCAGGTCDFDAIDRQSAGRFGGQPQWPGCTECALFGGTGLFELGAYKGTATVTTAYLVTTNHLTGATDYQGLPSTAGWLTGQAIKITGLTPATNLAGPGECKYLSSALVLKISTPGGLYQDTSPVRIEDCP